MAKAAMGAKVMYCGHDGWFVADIFRIGSVNVVKGPASGICGDKLVRSANHEATHSVVDFPSAGMWAPNRGVLVVPASQVKELSHESTTKKRLEGRHGTHYETIPHSACQDPARCDCSCKGCMRAWRAWARERAAREIQK